MNGDGTGLNHTDDDGETSAATNEKGTVAVIVLQLVFFRWDFSYRMVRIVSNNLRTVINLTIVLNIDITWDLNCNSIMQCSDSAPNPTERSSHETFFITGFIDFYHLQLPFIFLPTPTIIIIIIITITIIIYLYTKHQ